MVMEKKLHHDIDDLVAEILPPQKLAVVDDVNTEAALGGQVFKALKGRFPCTHVTLKDNVTADDHFVQYLRTQTLSADALVAVGSGTINDLCKYVAHLDRKPYIVFPTAASMNGYLSANASITSQGHKKTMLAFMPLAVMCDMSVISAAPARLTKSGFGDSLARSTAQADWLLSHLLLDTHYETAPFELLAELEPELFDNARGIAKADVGSITLLTKTLLLSGLGMTISGGSYPASQGEHMISHTYEMINSLPAKQNKAPLHGESIAVTTLTMARLQEALLQSKPIIRPDDFSSEQIIHLLGSETATQARKAFDGKCALIEHSLEEDNLKNWDETAAQIEKHSVPSKQIEALLKTAECPVVPGDIGWHEKDYEIATNYARYTRERFTFLDLK